MAITPNIQAPEASVLVVMRQSAQAERVPEGQVLAAYNVPADTVAGTQGLMMIPYRRTSQSLKATQAHVAAVVRGRIDNPKLRAWTYTLDGHDYYVLKLGTQGKTLVFDLSTGQWSWWASGDEPRWRVSLGMNWKASFNIPINFGSNVIVGDDSFGALWVLDPNQGQDDSLLEDTKVPFPRVATGQMTATDRQFVPIYSVNLRASLGQPALTANTVKLEYSDDQGNTYVTADEPQVSVAGSYDQEFTWRSLGQVTSPGRLFRITDDGAFARIDAMDVNE